MLNLSFHGDTEDGNIEELEEGAGEGDSGCLGCGVPELELWKSADEGSELLVAMLEELDHPPPPRTP